MEDVIVKYFSRSSETNLKSLLKNCIDFNDKIQFSVSKQNIFIMKKEMRFIELQVY